MQQHPTEMTLTVVETVADVLNVAPQELPPLSEAIDIAALDAAVSEKPGPAATVTFRYAGLRVTVKSRDSASARHGESGALSLRGDAEPL